MREKSDVFFSPITVFRAGAYERGEKRGRVLRYVAASLFEAGCADYEGKERKREGKRGAFLHATKIRT